MSNPPSIKLTIALHSVYSQYTPPFLTLPILEPSVSLLTSYRKQFAYYRQLGQGTINQLSDDELQRDDAAGSNSVAVITKHLHGNMLSRWTDFLITDGEKSWRNRDDEFVDDFADRAALQSAWNEGWDLLETVLCDLQPESLDRTVYIRNDGHTVAEALNRQLAHYSYHVGQIVLLGKQLKGKDWQSLSIPRGQSKAYNAAKFGQQKRQRHFTDG